MDWYIWSSDHHFGRAPVTKGVKENTGKAHLEGLWKEDKLLVDQNELGAGALDSRFTVQNNDSPPCEFRSTSRTREPAALRGR